jgi:hypothetical protein
MKIMKLITIATPGFDVYFFIIFICYRENVPESNISCRNTDN